MTPKPVHPHARGEHHGCRRIKEDHHGSSPRPWGTRARAPGGQIYLRFIPTPVGNTWKNPALAVQATVHPHARGEHLHHATSPRSAAGSSPRPWGTPATSSQCRNYDRFIPTPVGNTCPAGPPCTPSRVHPHARGEHDIPAEDWRPGDGSSPRPWGTRTEGRRLEPGRRFIPTPVGNTLHKYKY